MWRKLRLPRWNCKIIHSTAGDCFAKQWPGERLKSLVAKHRDQPYAGGPYVIQPTETPIEYNRDGRPYPFGTPSALPHVTCIGRFDSLQPAQDKNCDFSGLVITWYQDEFAFPIEPSMLSKLLAIDWETHAADMEY